MSLEWEQFAHICGLDRTYVGGIERGFAEAELPDAVQYRARVSAMASSFFLSSFSALPNRVTRPASRASSGEVACGSRENIWDWNRDVGVKTPTP